MNGVFSAIPFTFLSLVTILAGPLADFLRSRYLSTTVTRKLFASTCELDLLVVSYNVVSARNNIQQLAIFRTFCLYVRTKLRLSGEIV